MTYRRHIRAITLFVANKMNLDVQKGFARMLRIDKQKVSERTPSRAKKN